MAAHSEVFPWPPHYGHFKFFEARMRAHRRVSDFKGLGDGVYELTLSSGKTLQVFICECYSFGAAEYLETFDNIGPMDAIVISSAWCGYTLDAKRSCREDEIGLFNIADFMAALNKEEIWSYLNEHETEVFKKKGWL